MPKPEAAKTENKPKEKAKKKATGISVSTKLKAKKLAEHAQPVNVAVQDTSWQTTVTGTLAVTVALHATSKSNFG
jgi:hypothetical protein